MYDWLKGILKKVWYAIQFRHYTNRLDPEVNNIFIQMCFCFENGLVANIASNNFVVLRQLCCWRVSEVQLSSFVSTRSIFPYISRLRSLAHLLLTLHPLVLSECPACKLLQDPPSLTIDYQAPSPSRRRGEISHLEAIGPGEGRARI